MDGRLEAHRGGRLRWALIYLTILSCGLLTLAASLFFGRRIEPAPVLPELAVVTGSGATCLGERVATLQSGEFVDLYQPGPPGAETQDEQLGDRVARGRLDRRSGEGTLRGACISDGALAGRTYVAEIAALSEDGAAGGKVIITGSLVVSGQEPRSISISATDLRAGAGVERAGEVLTGSEVVARIFLALAVVLLAARALGFALAALRQPRVIGEIMAGIFLGPSLLGGLFPEVTAYLFPAEVVAVLRVMAQFGLVFFMFLIGLELDAKLVRRSGHLAVLISHVSIVVPFALGTLLALLLYPLLGGGSFTAFALFMGTAMAITAFPVLARILTDTGIQRTHVGALAITCAAVDDFTAWCILAVVVGIAKAAGPFDAVVTSALAIGFLVVMLFVIRPALRPLARRYKANDGISSSVIGLLICGLLVAAWITEMIGIHAIFGAFLLGASLPRSKGLQRAITERIEDLTLLFLLPIFFAVVGLSTRFGMLDQWLHWAIAGLVIAAAVAGKWGGSTVAAHAVGVGWRDASALGLLMNTRGITEIVILTIGRSLGVISPALFTIMVLMALFTTLMATPLLSRFYLPRIGDQQPVEQPKIVAEPRQSEVDPVVTRG